MPTSSPLRSFAEEPAAWGEIRPESGYERILTDAYCLLFGPTRSFTQVSRLRLDPDRVTEALHEVRTEVTARDRSAPMWNVSSSATPTDLVDRLITHGLVADDHQTSLVLEREPPQVECVTVRRISGLDELRLARGIGTAVFGNRPDEPDLETTFARERSGDGPRVYLAFVDGRAAGTAQTLLEEDCPGGLMIGGCVLPEARGRGAYRALVRARWEDAIAAGFAGLCVQARVTSRPILERAGFERVAEHEILRDPAC